MPNIVITPYAAQQPADKVNAALKTSIKAMDQAKHGAVLWFKEIVERKLFLELGYSSIYQYATVELEFSRTRTGNFLQLARKLESLPHLKQGMEDGEVGYTKALEIIKVANLANEEAWVQKARTQSRQDLRRNVDRARRKAVSRRKADPNQGALPIEPDNGGNDEPTVALTHRLTFELSSEQLARYEALVEQAHKLGGAPTGSTRADLLLEAMAALVAEGKKASERDQVGRPASSPAMEQGRPDHPGHPGHPGIPGHRSGEPLTQIHVHHCPECRKSTITTSRGEAELTAGELEKLACDARIARQGEPNRATIPPGTRRRVLARDQHRCQAPGCANTRFLEIHHIVPRARGGTNAEENLVTLCGACHRLKHVDWVSRGTGKRAPAGK